MYGRRLKRSQLEKFSSNMVSQIGSTEIRIIQACTAAESSARKKNVVVGFTFVDESILFRRLHRKEQWLN